MIILSIIIPTYNSEATIGRAIESCLKLDVNYEIIVVDDGSSDKTISTIKEQYQYKNIKIFQQSHLGAGSARNKGILNAKGKYILFLDSDDKLKNIGLIKKSLEYIKNNINIINFSDINLPLKSNMTLGFLKKSNLGLIASQRQVWDSGPINKIYKKSFLVKNAICFPKDIIVGEDMIFNLECLNSISTLKELKFVNTSIYEIIYNKKSTTNTVLKKNFFKDNIVLLQNVYSRVSLETFKTFFIKRYLMFFVQLLKSDKSSKEVFEYLVQFKKKYNIRVNNFIIEELKDCIGRFKTGVLILIYACPRLSKSICRLYRRVHHV